MLASAAIRDVPVAGSSVTHLVCPLCTYEQQQVLACRQIDAATLVLEIHGGCDCRWRLQLQQIEARTHATVQITQPCSRPSGLKPLADAAEAERLLDEYEL